MLAKQLECILSNYFAKTDISGRHPADIARRFESLRGAKLIPSGRRKNIQQFKSQEIIAGILSVVTTSPGYAFVATISLKDLRPIGGVSASFQNCETFAQAIEKLLTDEASLQTLISVSVSNSEIATNSHGFAIITYRAGSEIKTAYFISHMAVSLTQSRAESTFDPQKFLSGVITQTILGPKLFKEISNCLKRETQFPPPEITKIPFEDEGEERQKELRAEYLGLRPSSKFLNIGVDNQVTWPLRETVVSFEGYRLILLPRTKDHMTSIHIDLSNNHLTTEDAYTLINRFLSIMSWCDDSFAVLQDGWSGNPVPVPVPKRNLAFTTATQWTFDRKLPETEEARLALALFREGINARYNFSISFAVLSFFKIIEKHFNNEDIRMKPWVLQNISDLEVDACHAITLRHFHTNCASKCPFLYLKIWNRVAVAHANNKGSIDPDDTRSLSRMYNSADILRLLARRLIKNELGVSDCFFDGS